MNLNTLYSLYLNNPHGLNPQHGDCSDIDRHTFDRIRLMDWYGRLYCDNCDTEYLQGVRFDAKTKKVLSWRVPKSKNGKVLC